MPTTVEIGQRAEELACSYLEQRGFHIVARNWRHGKYELDIVADKTGTLHIIEVKCRRTGGLTCPEQALDAIKSNNIMKAAEFYIEKNNVRSEVQFDLVAVEYSGSGTEIRFYPDVIHPRW